MQEQDGGVSINTVLGDLLGDLLGFTIKYLFAKWVSSRRNRICHVLLCLVCGAM
jgi:hypothetical protein